MQVVADIAIILHAKIVFQHYLTSAKLFRRYQSKVVRLLLAKLFISNLYELKTQFKPVNK